MCLLPVQHCGLCFEFWFCGQHLSVHKYPDIHCFGNIWRYGMMWLASCTATTAACRWSRSGCLSPAGQGFFWALPTCPLHSLPLLLGPCEQWPFNPQWGHIQHYSTALLIQLMTRLPGVAPKSFHHGSGFGEVLVYLISWLPWFSIRKSLGLLFT